ncbi:hypothetical protein [Laribacter hongkongensis]|uniref:hypothetical protein n=1 Tax=Laribacter hongkongensis TaxID=168471 RepID=UPI001EFC7551|nr:hypothetical protein [Laribacter hongkongensis]MCG9081555.1 hypothetical protein [Laribacter hongkongensis]
MPAIATATTYYANSAAKLSPAAKLLPVTATGRPSRGHDNSLVAEHLSQYLNFTDFMRDAPGPFRAALDDVITGATRLDLGGNSRPLGKARLFTLLAHLPAISTATTAEAFQCPDRHARKIAAVLRVASTALHEWIVRHMEMDAAGWLP